MKVALMICAVCAWPSVVAPQASGERDILLQIVDGRCVPDHLHDQTRPPCVMVNLQKRVAIIRDIRGVAQHLLIPTDSIPGIEDPTILANGAENYFADAWEARQYVMDTLHARQIRVPDDSFALAINSVPSRGEPQLHIHIDCLGRGVLATLRANAPPVEDRWSSLKIRNHNYIALWVPGNSLGSNNPFKLLAYGIPAASGNMGDQTLVVVGLHRGDGAVGFIILQDQVNNSPGDMAHGEDLLDHSCGTTP